MRLKSSRFDQEMDENTSPKVRKIVDTTREHRQSGLTQGTDCNRYGVKQEGAMRILDTETSGMTGPVVAQYKEHQRSWHVTIHAR